ncbi:MAG: N-acetylmuramoyl-L-alanine amidase [Acidobacteria bacterium]|nr:N-acetylmuramoyl-L-alanine amidase [Acidobacteriota bacterium]
MSPHYTVKFYKGDYKARQLAANADKALGYFEQHFNAVDDPGPKYCHAKVATNASKTSIAMAEWYAKRVAAEFGIPLGFDNGVDKGGRGNGNLIHTAMPAILLEPLFVSNPAGAALARSPDGQKRLAKCLADTVRNFYPNGGKIAFSVGHKYKTSSPNDRGALAYGGGTEAEYAEIVLEIAKQLLETGEVKPCGQ